MANKRAFSLDHDAQPCIAAIVGTVKGIRSDNDAIGWALAMAKVACELVQTDERGRYIRIEMPGQTGQMIRLSMEQG